MEGNDVSNPRLVLSASEVGHELGLTRRHVHNLRKAGLLRGVRVTRGELRSSWRFLASDVLSYLEALNADDEDEHRAPGAPAPHAAPEPRLIRPRSGAAEPTPQGAA